MNVAEAFPRFFALNREYFACLSQNATNAPCRNAYCNGTLDTSCNQACSRSALNAVNARSRRSRGVPREVGLQGERLYTYRTHPNVRFSRPACCGVGWNRYRNARRGTHT